MERTGDMPPRIYNCCFTINRIMTKFSESISESVTIVHGPCNNNGGEVMCGDGGEVCEDGGEVMCGDGGR